MGSQAKEYDGGTLLLSQACYHAVYDYPGKVAAVAAALNMNPRVLANKLNGNTNTHLLNADEVLGILKLTRDNRIVSALCEPAGVVWHWLDEVREAPSDLDVLSRASAAIDAANTAVQELVKALESGDVDRQEMRRIDAAVFEGQRQLQLIGKVAERFLG